MLIGPMNVQMPPAEAAALELSARALKPHAAAPAAEMVLPPGIDQEVLDFARQMFVGGPGWPQLPPRRSFALDPSNLQLFVAAVVVDFLFRHEKARFEHTAGVWLQKSEARGYLLAAQCGHGLLTSAQIAHDVGSKAAKQVAEAEREAKRVGKLARRRALEA